MVVLGTAAVWGLAVAHPGAAILASLGVAILALILIWDDGSGKKRPPASVALPPGQRTHGGCLTAFVAVWIALELYGLVASIITPSPDPFVDWGALARYGALPIVLRVGLSDLLSACRVGCLIGVWVWWKKWCVLGFLSAAAIDLAVELVGRATLGPPSPSVQSSDANLAVPAFLLEILIFLVFAELARREWTLLE